MNSPFRAVLFDLDGTLVDTIGLIVASYRHALERVTGSIPSDAEAKGWIGKPLRAALQAMHPERAGEIEQAYQEWNLANTERLIRPYPGMADVLDELAGGAVTTGVVTSKRQAAADRALGLVGLGGRIDVLASLESTTTHKPGPAPLLHAAERLQVPPADCVYVGDAVVDVLAARAAGMASIAVTWGAGDPDALRAAGPDRIVHEVAELRAELACGQKTAGGAFAV